MSHYNKHNFYRHTFCIFEEVSLPQVEQLKINYSSKSGSKYIFTETGVYRISNHWGRASNCRWRLSTSKSIVNQRYLAGFAKWDDFYPNDETSNLFFIIVNIKSKEVNFYHKNYPLYDGKALVRNAIQTSKRIQNIKIILNETSWSSYLLFDDFEVLQNEIIEELICSNKSFLDIKRHYL